MRASTIIAALAIMLGGAMLSLAQQNAQGLAASNQQCT
jgi:hypothetical protein